MEAICWSGGGKLRVCKMNGGQLWSERELKEMWCDCIILAAI